jgi:hypothetical protein
VGAFSRSRRSAVHCRVDLLGGEAEAVHPLSHFFIDATECVCWVLT